ncbi:hypothetical protein, partial [Enterobacter cloacae complex sp. CH23B]|uniref:hypothetical protein n=1 Tax=Enterobacter cloacae complex sp. CH23B TaxID=2511986 RepID=UPI001CA4C0D0
LLQLTVESSKLPEKDIVAKAGLAPQYRETAEILFETKVKTNQPLPEGWIHISSHCHKLARTRITKGRRTHYDPDTKTYHSLTPYEVEMTTKRQDQLEQEAIYRLIQKENVGAGTSQAPSR